MTDTGANPDLPPPLAEQANALIAAVGRLSDAVGNLDERLAIHDQRLEEQSEDIGEEKQANLENADLIRRNQRLIRILAATILFDLVLTVVVAVAFNQAHEAIRAACHSANDSRTKQVQLWEHVLEVSPSATPEAKARQDDFLIYVHNTFKQRDCS